MSTPYTLEAFLDLLGPLADTKPKLVALTLILAYITYRIIQQFTKPPPQIQPIQQNDFTFDEKHPPSTQLQEYDIKEEPKDIYSKRIPISTEMLTIFNCGYQPINGVYRWFLATRKWCFFTDHNNKHFALENNIAINRVYTALQTKNISFEWDKSVLICWVISDINSEIIYYAAPQISKEYLPSDNEWIAVQGDQPMPQIFANVTDKTDEYDLNDEFGNHIPNNEEIRNVFRQCDADNTGVIGRDKVMEGFKILGYIIDNISVLNIMSNDKDMLSENAFCMALKKYSSDIDQQNIMFNLNKDIDIDERMEDIKEETDEYSDEYSNEDNGVIVHKEMDNDEDEEDDSISDLERANDDDDDEDGSISDLEQ
eukprot:145915_1